MIFIEIKKDWSDVEFLLYAKMSWKSRNLWAIFNFLVVFSDISMRMLATSLQQPSAADGQSFLIVVSHSWILCKAVSLLPNHAQPKQTLQKYGLLPKILLLLYNQNWCENYCQILDFLLHCLFSGS